MRYKKFLNGLSTEDASVFLNKSLKTHCSLRVGGIAKHFIVVKNLNALKAIVKRNKKLIILGAGTNILLKSKKYSRTFIVLAGDFKKIDFKTANETIFVKVGAGVNLFSLNNFLKEKEISGLEWSHGIPGTVGGAIIMNAGSFGQEFGNFVSSVKILQNNEVKWVKNFSFGYRTSSFKRSKVIILGCILKLNKGNYKEIESAQKAYFIKKKETQPYGENSAGSVFKHFYLNGIKYYPAKIIDNMGMKGVRIGEASVSEKHAGFIVTKNAKATDVIKLIKLIKKRIKKETGQTLEEEIIII